MPHIQLNWRSDKRSRPRAVIRLGSGKTVQAEAVVANALEPIDLDPGYWGEEEQRLGEEDDDLLRQRIEAQRLILDACAATAARTREGRSLRYAARYLLLP